MAYAVTGRKYDLYNNYLGFETIDDFNRELIAAKDLTALRLSASQWVSNSFYGSRLPLDSGILEHSLLNFYETQIRAIVAFSSWKI